MIQCGQLDLHGLNEFILLREGVVFHVLRGLFRFSLNLVNLLRGGSFLVTAHRESGGGKERDEQFPFFPWPEALPDHPADAVRFNPAQVSKLAIICHIIKIIGSESGQL